MKRLFLSALTVLIAVSGFAQDFKGDEKVNIKITVSAVREKYYVGPYAKYAQKYLGVEARQTSSSATRIESVRMTSSVSGTGDGYVFNFGEHIPDKPDYTSVPLLKAAVGQKNVETAASAAAEQLMNIRQKRYQILTGDTDMSLSGESLKLTLDEFSRQENELLRLFLGYTVTSPIEGEFVVTPSADNQTGIYVAFRISENGLLPANHLEGRMVTLEVVPVNLPEPADETAADASPKKKPKAPKNMKWETKSEFIPADCTVRLRDGATVVLQGRVSVPQLGYTRTYEELVPLPVVPK
ncbi:MAG: DUF4831 family protein [Candidatus Cryptobacteroides sp.]